jgi:hypothetical protein
MKLPVNARYCYSPLATSGFVLALLAGVAEMLSGGSFELPLCFYFILIVTLVGI